MDGLAIRVLSEDWDVRYHMARIDKIHQPSERELVLTLRTRTGTSRVILSAHRMYGRAHELISARPANPEEPPMFCMRLRKHLEGGRILKVRQQGFDRVLELVVENQNELGDTVQFILILEIMGKHSNLILCSTDSQQKPVRVLDSIVHVTHEMSRARQVLPGLPYIHPPTQDKIQVNELTREHLEGLHLQDVSTKVRNRTLMSRIQGLGLPTVDEICFRVADNKGNPAFVDSLVTGIQALFESSLNRGEPASVGLDELGRPIAAAPFQLHSCVRFRLAENLDAALDTVYHSTLTHRAVSNRAKTLIEQIDNQLDHLRGKLVKLKQLLAEAHSHDDLRIRGELLTAYAHTLQKGVVQAQLPDFYEEDRMVAIDLDPAMTAMENAQRYFKQASRKKRSVPILQAEIESTHGDIAYLETALVHLLDVTAENLSGIEQELAQQGFIRLPQNGKAGKRQKAVTGPGQPNMFTSSDGFIIRIGRNNLQNDRLTLRQSQPNDLWFHVKEQAGSHVVIQAENRTVPEQTIHEAALLAAYFSKARDSGNVAVDYTHIKQVWKAKGARPGHVLYEGQKTLYVTPDRVRLAPLLEQQAK